MSKSELENPFSIFEDWDTLLILRHLYIRGPSSLTTLEIHLPTPNSQIPPIIAFLQAKGLVEGDEKRYLLTEQGEALYGWFLAKSVEGFNLEKEMAEMRDSLKNFYDKLVKYCRTREKRGYKGFYAPCESNCPFPKLKYEDCDRTLCFQMVVEDAIALFDDFFKEE